MGLNITEKLIASQLVEGEPEVGRFVTLRINQTLAHDVTGPLVLSLFDQLTAERIQTDLSIFYVDHQLVPTTVEAVERLRYLRAAAHHAGAHFSRPGNGISHHVHLERMATPGRTLLATSGHCQVLGAASMLALTADAVELAAAMAGEPYRWRVPEVFRVHLHGKSKPFISAKDIGLELLRRRGLGGLAGYVVEFDGPGARALGVYERATIAHLGPALGALTTVFPSDEKTRIFLQRQRRSKSWRRIEADNDAIYAQSEDVDLGALEPLVMCSTAGEGEVRLVREVQETPIQEVLVGSCASGSIRDLMSLAGIMRGKKVHPDCTFTISPSSRQALEALARGEADGGSLADLIAAGVRILETSCGPCEARRCLPHGSGSVRTFLTDCPVERDAEVYIVSPETAAACAIHGQLTDPRKLRRPPKVKLPRQLQVDDSMIIKPPRDDSELEAPPTTPLAAPAPAPVGEQLRARVVDLRTASGSLAPRSDTCLVGGRCLSVSQLLAEVGPDQRRQELRLVIAESFAPSCDLSLAHAGVVPLRFLEPSDAEQVNDGDELVFEALGSSLRRGEPVAVSIDGVRFEVACDLDDRSLDVLFSGGLLAALKQQDKPRG